MVETAFPQIFYKSSSNLAEKFFSTKKDVVSCVNKGSVFSKILDASEIGISSWIRRVIATAFAVPGYSVPKLGNRFATPCEIFCVGADQVLRQSQRSLTVRALVLFIVGILFALVLNLLQVQRRVTLFPPEVLTSLFSSAWWIPPWVGAGSAFIGIIYPFVDKKLGKPHRFKREWSSVMRCIAVFVGINHASAKIAFANNLQLSITLGAMSVGLWWLFDRSRSGFGLGVAIAVLSTCATQILVYNGIFQYSEPDFLYVRSWIPCIFFSGGITIGSLGRQLAFSEENDLIEQTERKLHKD
ncbi:Insulin-induced gene 2 [Hypsibius exemplaris]|uniref:Insulin-induced gene 2 n=1 Tax=Hypsibius exemplaris TaxID=2072580 RepID=A0A1W0XEM8_HYPEX|nr:Insulin-induced gene 2 [Hypsibius exemplaris]